MQIGLSPTEKLHDRSGGFRWLVSVEAAYEAATASAAAPRLEADNFEGVRALPGTYE
jgi:hypothetical protein